MKCRKCKKQIANLSGHGIDKESLNVWEKSFLKKGGDVDYDSKRHIIHRCKLQTSKERK